MLGALALGLAGAPAAAAATSCDYSQPTLEDIGEGAHPTFSVDGRDVIFNSTREGGAGGQGVRPGNTQGALRIYRSPMDPATGKFSTEGPQVECLTCKHERPPGAEGSFDGTAQVSPNGKKILFTSSRDHEPAPASAPGGGIGQDVYVMDVDGSDPVRLTTTPSNGGNYHPQWSFDGKRIFWGRNYEDYQHWELLVADYVDDPQPHLERRVRLTAADDTRWYEPHGFSPDGRRVIFTAALDNLLNGEIYTMELETGPGGRITGPGRIKRLTNNPYWDEHAHYRHDGSKIAWITSRDHPSNVTGLLMTGSSQLSLPTTFDNYLVVPGLFLLIAGAFDPTSPGALDIYLMDPDGSNPLKVTDRQGAADLDWSPDGCKIVFRNRGNRVGLVTFPAREAAQACVEVRGRVRGRRVGPARLGRKRAAQRRALGGRLRRRRGGMDRWCVAGGGTLRIGYATARLARSHPGRSLVRRSRGRALLVLTTSRRVSARGVRVGDRASRLLGLRRLRVGRNIWFLARGGKSALVFKTRRGRVLELGLADRRLSDGRRAARRLLHGWHL